MRRHLIFLGSVLTASLLLAAGCAEPAAEADAEAGPEAGPEAAAVVMPPLETRADSLAMEAYEASGGPDAWAALPYLRFDFGFDREGARSVSRKHLWNRQTGDYRVEWGPSQDSTYVALFNVHDQAGQVYLNGEPVAAAENEEMLQQAYRGFINDTYWLLAPLKMLDPGVARTYVADSSGSGMEVVQLAFENVGLTPGDRYWMFLDESTGRLREWAFELESGNRGRFAWTGYETLQTPAGPLHVATRKEAADRPFALLTDNVAAPETVEEGMFTDPQPRL